MTPQGSKDASCEQHGPYSSLCFVFGGRELWSGCPTCDAAARRQHAARVSSEHRREVASQRQQDAQIPQRFVGKGLADYQAETREQKMARRVAERYIETWQESRRLGRCLVFSGWPGTGKTHLAAAIVQAVTAAGGRALFRSVPDAIGLVKSAYDGDLRESQAYERLRAPDLLVLDDVGATKLSDHDNGVLFRIVNMRYEDQRPTIMTTNLQAEALEEFLGDRITDRLRENGGMLVKLNWESHRK